MGCNVCGKVIISHEEFDKGYCNEHNPAPQASVIESPPAQINIFITPNLVQVVDKDEWCEKCQDIVPCDCCL